MNYVEQSQQAKAAAIVAHIFVLGRLLEKAEVASFDKTWLAHHSAEVSAYCFARRLGVSDEVLRKVSAKAARKAKLNANDARW